MSVRWLHPLVIDAIPSLPRYWLTNDHALTPPRLHYRRIRSDDVKRTSKQASTTMKILYATFLLSSSLTLCCGWDKISWYNSDLCLSHYNFYQGDVPFTRLRDCGILDSPSTDDGNLRWIYHYGGDKWPEAGGQLCTWWGFCLTNNADPGEGSYDSEAELLGDDINGPRYADTIVFLPTREYGSNVHYHRIMHVGDGTCLYAVHSYEEAEVRWRLCSQVGDEGLWVIPTYPNTVNNLDLEGSFYADY